MADQIQATPRNSVLGLFSDIVNLPLQYMSSPERTQQMQGTAQFLYDTGIPKTLERLSYGDSLFSGAGGLGGTTRMRPETADALMNVAPMLPAAGRVGRTVGRMAGEEINAAMTGQPTRSLLGQITPKPLRMADTSYRGSHTAPSSEFGAPLHDLTGGGQMYPADVYSSNAARYYGAGEPFDQKAFSIAQQYRDKPNATVTIYRAVPKETSNSEKLAEIEKQMASYMRRGTLPKDSFTDNGSKWYDWAYEERDRLRNLPDQPTQDINDINAGDWVTLTREYAKNHGEAVLNNQYKILSKKVKAKELWTNADSIHEFGYQPQKLNAPQQAALDLAQERAALPVEQGGLGLPADNTAADRAKAMGGKDMVHFSRTGGDYTTLDSGQYAIAPFDAVGTHVGTPQAAMDRFRNTTATTDQIKGTTYPVTILGDKPLMNQNGMPWGEDDLNAFLRKEGGHNWSDVNGGKMTYQDMNAALRKKLFEEQGYTSIPYFNEVEGKGSISYIVPPENIRSRFAAFDPFRKDLATAMAMGVAAPDLLAQTLGQYQVPQETTPMYTDPFGNTIGSSIR